MPCGNSAMSEADRIVERFTENLPSVNRAYAVAFAEGMVKYNDAFQAHRKDAMNCEVNADYLAERSFVAEVPYGEFWIFCPLFMKTVAEAIEQLFRTTIIGLWVDCVRMSSKTYFVDKQGNRWSLEFVHDKEVTKIYAMMPRLATLFAATRRLTQAELDEQGRDAKCIMLVHDVSEWRS